MLTENNTYLECITVGLLCFYFVVYKENRRVITKMSIMLIYRSSPKAKAARRQELPRHSDLRSRERMSVETARGYLSQNSATEKQF